MASTAGPARLTRNALLQVLLALPTLLALVLTVVGGATALLVVGIPVVLAGLPMLRWIADRHRTLAAEALGHPVPTERRSVEGQHALRRLQTWAADPMSWRELAWALVSTTVGLAISLTVVLLALLIVTLVLWWFATPQLMTLRSLLDARLLSRGSHQLLEERVAELTETRAERSTTPPPSCAASSATCTTARRPGWSRCGMNLGLAEELVETDPTAARTLLAEARRRPAPRWPSCATWSAASTRRCSPSAASRDAVRALALDLAAAGRGRRRTCPAGLPAPVESAVYFAVAEALANVGKHARRRARLGRPPPRRRPAHRRGRRRRPRRRRPGARHRACAGSSGGWRPSTAR